MPIILSENDSQELAGKKKLVINEESFLSAPRKENSQELSDSVQETIDGAAFFDGAQVDKLRVVVGKNWDFREKNGSSDKSFSSDWGAPVVFQERSAEFDPCAGTQEFVEGTGNFALSNSVIKEKVKLNFSRVFAEKVNEPPPAGIASTVGGPSWINWVKRGVITETGKTYAPIIRTDKAFFDYYHEGINPFTPAEMLSKQPSGKAFFANYKTYYNERLDSAAYEKAVGVTKIGFQLLQNSLPNIYGFIKLLANDSLSENDLFSLKPIIEELQLYDGTAPGSTEEKNIFKVLLKKLPLEALITKFGSIGYQPLNQPEKHSKIIEKIISLDFDKVDGDSLFSDYFNEYIQPLDLPSSFYLEKSMTNLVFSGDSLKLLNKADQYKRYFPFYAELEFTAKLNTSIGDAVKQFFLTKLMSEIVLNNTTPTEAAAYTDSWLVEISQLAALGGQLGAGGEGSPYPVKNFMDYSQESAFETGFHQTKYYLANDGTVVPTNSEDIGPLSQIEPQTLSPVQQKRSVNLPLALEYWLNPIDSEFEGVYNGEQKDAGPSFSKADLRNYLSIFRNDFNEPVNINSDENIIFKKLFGSAFYAKLISTYNTKKRTYEDIINGVPAYTEDLFYRIEKIVIDIDPVTGEAAEERVVQNILFPNTSELDIVKYVDTQLKYAKYATYKYNVYAHRLVFGSKYRYYWPTQTNGNSSFDYEDYVIDLSRPRKTYKAEELLGISVEALNKNLVSYNAVLNVEVEPSIMIVEDRMFSTPAIIILDKPPVIPDVNIVPYRAVNNRIKILMSGASDRYRAAPVIMLESDRAEFDQILAAQLSADGKVEFGSDDPVDTYQIFRTQERPRSYEDFELYDQVTQGVYEEQILPNSKYYYTFRAIDTHNHVSNPTPVYEVELIDEKGAVKPIIRLIDMEPPTNKTIIKDCQKYIYLKPTLKQLYFSSDPAVDSIFSEPNQKKKYKMRLTSKGSGKKIDINFSFKKKIQTE